MSFLGTDRRIVFLCRTVNTIPHKIKKIKIKLDDEEFTYKRVGAEPKTYPINTKLPAYRDGNDWYYMVDMETNQQLLLGRTGNDKVLLDAETIDLIIGKSIVKQVLTALQSMWSNPTTILTLIFLAMACLTGGFLLGQLVEI